ncbi:hypothetical protein MXB_4740 [Myxobolus squamalis]|nr:hypothetical protein MXB_4740 [Myxobolus squamalis]
MEDFSLNFFTSPKVIRRINDVTGHVLGKKEKTKRCKLASLFRLLGYHGIEKSVCDHITLKLNENEILTNPFGLMTWEITASNLIKLDFHGNILHADPDSFYYLNKKNVKLHSLIYKSRSDARCIVHISCLKEGLLPLCEDALIIGSISYHMENENSLDDETNLLYNLGPTNKIFVIQNKGALVIGKSVEEIFFLVYHLNHACSVQLKCSCYHETSLKKLSTDKINVINQLISLPTKCATTMAVFEFEAHMRLLDRLVSQQFGDFYHSFAEKGRFERRNSDSGVVTSMNTAENGNKLSLEHPSDSFNDMSFNNDQIPSSESSKELMIRKSSMLFNDSADLSYNDKSFQNSTEPSVSKTRRLRNSNNDHSFVRRSKSLTSGVEKAIFRKMHEKLYVNERKT